MQFFGQGKPPVGIVYDCDMGNRIDSALAVALLYGIQAKGEARVISLSVSKPSLKAAEFCDVLARFYLGEPGPFGGGNPAIGLALDGKGGEDTPMLSAPLGRENPEGKPLYARNISKLIDTADPLAVMRNALTAQFDQNALVVLAGPATNLVKLLDLPGAKPLIIQKVKYLTVTEVASDIPAARRLFAEWPTPVVAVGNEVGEALPFPSASLDKEFAWAPAHPLVDAYKAYKPMPYDAPSCAMAAALYAARPAEPYFKASDPGTITVLDDGRLKLTPSAEGKHRTVSVDPEQKEKVLLAYVELASTKQVPRAVRPQRKKQ